MTKDTTKPSAGALRAAIACVAAAPKSINPITDLAHIIDRETGVTELLEAAKDGLIHLNVYRRGLKDSKDNLHCSDMGNAVPARLEQAIAKCQSGTGSE